VQTGSNSTLNLMRVEIQPKLVTVHLLVNYPLLRSFLNIEQIQNLMVVSRFQADKLNNEY